ncbi:MAG: hypothetical protein IKZ55_05155 [Bacteroidales bacterium]|nr:hypothetical protein [Bacteroidales bacterium]
MTQHNAPKNPCAMHRAMFFASLMGGGKSLKINDLQRFTKFFTLIFISVFLSLMPIAARAQFDVTHSTNGTIGTYTTLDDAINNCTLTTGSYTINVTADGSITGNTTVQPEITLSIEGNGHTVSRTSGMGGIRNQGTLTISNLTFDGHEYIVDSYNYSNIGFLYNYYYHGNAIATLSNCTIQNVRFVANESAAVTNTGATLTMTDCTITNCGDGNVNYSSSILCGGVMNRHYLKTGQSPTKGQVTMKNCNISKCSRGGVVNYGCFMTMEDCRVTECMGVGCQNSSSASVTSDYSWVLYPFLTFKGTNYIKDNIGAIGIINHEGEIIFEDGSITYIQNNDAGGIRNQTYTNIPYIELDLNHEVENYEARLIAKGSAQLIISGNSGAQEGGGIWSDGTIDFSGTGTKTITGNSATNFGGGIFLTTCIWNSPYQDLSSGTATLTNCIVGASDAPNTAQTGGGVYLRGGSLTINDGSCTYNTATVTGGGLYIAGDTAIFNRYTIQNNTAGNAGGVFLDEGTLTVNGGSCSYNTTSNNGGGFNVFRGTLTVNGGTYAYNTANGHGGGFYFYGYYGGGTVTFSGSPLPAINNNSAGEDGGGIYTNIDLTLPAMTLSDNTARYGGGIYVSSGKTFSATGATFINNVARIAGGGIYTNNGGTLTNCTVGTAGNGNSAGLGGGVYLKDGTLAVSGGSYCYNTAEEPGGGFYFDKGTVTFSGLPLPAINNNSAGSHGGGIYANIDLALPAMTISDNTASRCGGGIFVSYGKTFSATGTTFINNVATENGGAIYTEGGGTLTNCTVGTEDNSNSADKGGGVWSGGTLIVSGGTYAYNTATNGGAFYLSSCMATFNGGSYSNNTASEGGGGFYFSRGRATFSDSPVNNNSAANGGGFYIDGTNKVTGRVTLNEGSSITYNTATNQGGGVYINTNAEMTANVTGGDGVLIKYNHANNKGGGVYKLGSLKVGGKVVITDNTSGTP